MSCGYLELILTLIQTLAETLWTKMPLKNLPRKNMTKSHPCFHDFFLEKQQSTWRKMTMSSLLDILLDCTLAERGVINAIEVEGRFSVVEGADLSV